MITKFMNAHLKLANGKFILLLLTLFLLANLVLIPAVYPKFQTLDTLYSYTPEKARELISSYGEQGRQFCLLTEVTLDLAYPFITALLFCLLILYTFKQAFPNNRGTWNLSLSSYLVMLADFLENACVVTMLLGYPREFVTIARLSNFFTIAKFALSPLQLLFLVGLIGWCIQAIRTRRSR